MKSVVALPDDEGGGMEEAARRCVELSAPLVSDAIDELTRAAETLKEALTRISALEESSKNIPPPDGDEIRSAVRESKELLEKTLKQTETHVTARKIAQEAFVISVFGRTGVGKSTLTSALLGQNGTRVSAGGGGHTTQLSVGRRGSVCVVDAPGLDDLTSRSSENAELAKRAVMMSDLVLLCFDSQNQKVEECEQLVEWINTMGRPVLVVLNVRNPAWRNPLHSLPSPHVDVLNEHIVQHTRHLSSHLRKIAGARHKDNKSELSQSSRIREGNNDSNEDDDEGDERCGLPIIAVSAKRALFACAGGNNSNKNVKNNDNGQEACGIQERDSEDRIVAAATTAAATATDINNKNEQQTSSSSSYQGPDRNEWEIFHFCFSNDEIRTVSNVHVLFHVLYKCIASTAGQMRVKALRGDRAGVYRVVASALEGPANLQMRRWKRLREEVLGLMAWVGNPLADPALFESVRGMEGGASFDRVMRAVLKRQMGEFGGGVEETARLLAQPSGLVTSAVAVCDDVFVPLLARGHARGRKAIDAADGAGTNLTPEFVREKLLPQGEVEESFQLLQDRLTQVVTLELQRRAESLDLDMSAIEQEVRGDFPSMNLSFSRGSRLMGRALQLLAAVAGFAFGIPGAVGGIFMFIVGRKLERDSAKDRSEAMHRVGTALEQARSSLYKAADDQIRIFQSRLLINVVGGLCAAEEGFARLGGGLFELVEKSKGELAAMEGGGEEGEGEGEEEERIDGAIENGGGGGGGVGGGAGRRRRGELSLAADFDTMFGDNEDDVGVEARVRRIVIAAVEERQWMGFSALEGGGKGESLEERWRKVERVLLGQTRVNELETRATEKWREWIELREKKMIEENKKREEGGGGGEDNDALNESVDVIDNINVVDYSDETNEPSSSSSSATTTTTGTSFQLLKGITASPPLSLGNISSAVSAVGDFVRDRGGRVLNHLLHLGGGMAQSPTSVSTALDALNASKIQLQTLVSADANPSLLLALSSIERAEKQLSSPYLTLSLLGEYSAGKTSLIRRLLLSSPSPLHGAASDCGVGGGPVTQGGRAFRLRILPEGSGRWGIQMDSQALPLSAEGLIVDDESQRATDEQKKKKKTKKNGDEKKKKKTKKNKSKKEEKKESEEQGAAVVAAVTNDDGDNASKINKNGNEDENKEEEEEEEEEEDIPIFLLDLPGLGSGSSDHDTCATHAARNSAAVILVTPPQIVTGTSMIQSLTRVIHGMAHIPAVPHIVLVSRSDELGIDPLLDPQGFDSRCRYKRNEAANLLRVAADRVHVISADPYGLFAQRHFDGSEIADLKWDGLAGVEGHIRSLVADLKKNKGHVAAALRGTVWDLTEASDDIYRKLPDIQSLAEFASHVSSIVIYSAASKLQTIRISFEQRVFALYNRVRTTAEAELEDAYADAFALYRNAQKIASGGWAKRQGVGAAVGKLERETLRDANHVLSNLACSLHQLRHSAAGRRFLSSTLPPAPVATNVSKKPSDGHNASKSQSAANNNSTKNNEKIENKNDDDEDDDARTTQIRCAGCGFFPPCHCARRPAPPPLTTKQSCPTPPPPASPPFQAMAPVVDEQGGGGGWGELEDVVLVSGAECEEEGGEKVVVAAEEKKEELVASNIEAAGEENSNNNNNNPSSSSAIVPQPASNAAPDDELNRLVLEGLFRVDALCAFVPHMYSLGEYQPQTEIVESSSPSRAAANISAAAEAIVPGQMLIKAVIERQAEAARRTLDEQIRKMVEKVVEGPRHDGLGAELDERIHEVCQAASVWEQIAHVLQGRCRSADEAAATLRSLSTNLSSLCH